MTVRAVTAVAEWMLLSLHAVFELAYPCQKECSTALQALGYQETAESAWQLIALFTLPGMIVVAT